MPKACPYVVMRFAPSLIVVGMNHRILLRLTRIQREDYLWEFVLIRGYKSPQQNISVIRGICGFKAKPQISTNFHELFVGYMVCFSIILHTFAYIRAKKPFVS